jgi:hypothetical protein
VAANIIVFLSIPLPLSVPLFYLRLFSGVICLVFGPRRQRLFLEKKEVGAWRGRQKERNDKVEKISSFFWWVCAWRWPRSLFAKQGPASASLSAPRGEQTGGSLVRPCPSVGDIQLAAERGQRRKRLGDNDSDDQILSLFLAHTRARSFLASSTADREARKKDSRPPSPEQAANKGRAKEKLQGDSPQTSWT